MTSKIPVEATLEGPVDSAASEAERILRALPEWFGIEDALRRYVADVARMPTFVARVDGEVVGFLTLHRHFETAAEVHVVGVLPRFHRRGVGRQLQRRAEDWLVEAGVEYLQVKTIGPSSPDPNYARTRRFYRSMGFAPLEELPTLWDAHNPCLILVKRL